MENQNESAYCLDDEDKFDPKKASMAVITKGFGGGCILWYVGYHLYEEIYMAGITSLEDLKLDEAPQGISIWEGFYVWDHDGETGKATDTYPEGSFRVPTLEEWGSIQRGVPPWNKDDWSV